MLGNNVVAQFVAAGALAPLDDYFAAYGKEHGYDVAADVWPGDKGYYHLDDHWWASPVIVETRALYYRKDLMEKAGLDPNAPPQTWDDLVADAAKIKDATGTFGWAAPMSLDYFTVQNFMSTYLSYGARMLNDEGKCGFNSPEFRQALEVFTSAYSKGVTHPDAPSMPGQAFRRGFLDGNFAMIIELAEHGEGHREREAGLGRPDRDRDGAGRAEGPRRLPRRLAAHPLEPVRGEGRGREVDHVRDAARRRAAADHRGLRRHPRQHQARRRGAVERRALRALRRAAAERPAVPVSRTRRSRRWASSRSTPSRRRSSRSPSGRRRSTRRRPSSAPTSTRCSSR